MLMDLGAGLYTRQYFQPTSRYEQWTAGSQGHSVPVVEGITQGYGKAYQAEVIHYSNDLAQVRFILDLTQAYDCGNLRSLQREFVWKTGENDAFYELSICDHGQFNENPVSFTEVFISAIAPVISLPGVLMLGSIQLEFDADSWDLTTENYTIDINGGGRLTFWRIVLNAVKLSRDMTNESRVVVNLS